MIHRAYQLHHVKWKGSNLGLILLWLIDVQYMVLIHFGDHSIIKRSVEHMIKLKLRAQEIKSNLQGYNSKGKEGTTQLP